MPITPYTPTELAEFKAILDAKLEEAIADHAALKCSLADPEGYEGITKEELVNTIARQAKFIDHLNAALARIANRTYGICRVTGKPISKERLRLVPHATLSIEAKASVLDKSTTSTDTPSA